MRRVWIGAVIFTIALLAGCGSSGHTTPHASSPWGALVACLRKHPLFEVETGSGMNGAETLPDGARRNLIVWQGVTGHVIGLVGEYDSAGAAHAAGRAWNAAGVINRSETDGPLVYQWTQDTSSMNGLDILNCIDRYPLSSRHTSRAPSTSTVPPTSTSTVLPAGSYSGVASVLQVGPATDQSPCMGGITVGPNTSCPFARNVFNIVHHAYAVSHQIPARIAAFSPVTHKTYQLRCSLPDYGAEVVCTGYPASTSEVVLDKSSVTGRSAKTQTVPSQSASTTTTMQTQATPANNPCPSGEWIVPGNTECTPKPSSSAPPTTTTTTTPSTSTNG